MKHNYLKQLELSKICKRKIYKLVSSVKQVVFALALTMFSGTAYSQVTYTFSYTGSTQTISLPPGSYSIECWGADGGNATNGITPMLGGKGGYSKGVYTQAITATLNVYVGGHGGNASAANCGGGGGGMSDVAAASNTNIIIIAAGAGGGGTSGTVSEWSTGGDGGGLVGGTAIDGTGVTGGGPATGGSQTAGGFATAGSYGGGSPGGYGYGGGSANGTSNPASPSGTMHAAGGAGGNGGNGGWNGGGGGCTFIGGNDHAAGGGAGYYGGGGGRGDGGAGGGGSGYVGGVTSGVTSMSAQPGFVTNPDVTGNGRVLITELCSVGIYASGSNSLNPAICSGQSLTLTTTAVSNFTWSNGNTTNTTIVVSPTSGQSYSIIGTSSLACQSSGNISVTVAAALPVLTITNTPTSICLGKTATITAAGALSYTWTGGSPTVTNGVSFVPGPGVNVYTVSGQNGCGTSIATTTLTVASLPVSIASSTTSVCAGSPATLIATSAVSGYTWAPTSNTGSNTTVFPTVNTVYTVTASDGTCSGVATVSLSSIAIPTISIVPSATTVCEGAVVTMTANGAVSYSWSVGNQTGATLSDNPMMATSYVVTGTNALGCSSSANQIVVTVPSPTVNITTNKTIVCVGNPVNLLAGGSGANSYNWTGGPATAGYTANPVTTTVYTVTGIGTNCSTTKTISISVLLASVAVAVTPTSICSGATANLSATGANTYAWTGFSGFGANVSVTPTVTTTYTMIASTTGPGLSCPSSANITLTVFDNPTVTISASHSVVCKTDAAILLTGGGALTYTWSTNVTALTTTVHPQSTITYTNQGTDANGCINTGSLKITVNTCTGINELNTGVKGILVYPNPNNGAFTLSADSDITLKVINELGQEVKRITLSEENGYKASLTNLANGVYFVTGQNDRGKVNQKIIVTK